MSGLAINRWIVRRQRKILCSSIVVFILMVTYIMVFQEDIQIRESHYTPLSEQCLSDAASNLIHSICDNFSKGLAYGQYCQHLCIHKSVIVDNCIHHGRTYVLIGRNKGEEIVMKVKKTRDMKYTIQHFEEEALHSSINILRRIYSKGVENEVRVNLGDDSSLLFRKNIDTISQFIFGKRISHLTLPEMRASWSALGQDELIVTLLHQKLTSFSKYLGICGPMYILEKTTAYSDYFPEIIPTLSWNKRVRIAKSFLNLLRELEQTDIGALTHCDIQEGNFGLLRKESVVKAIDVDLVYSSKKVATVLTGTECASDKDCKFFDCATKCNVVARKCTNVSLTNNLQVMCRNIFQPRWPRTGLLSYFQPSHITKELNELLQTCRSQQFGTLGMNNSTVVGMMKDLDTLLNISLQTFSLL